METQTQNRERGWPRNNKTPAGIWRNGVKYFSTWYLAYEWNLTRREVYRWFRKRPHLCIKYEDRYWLCRTDIGRPQPGVSDTGIPSSILHDDFEYFSILALAAMRGISPNTCRKWVMRHLDIAVRIGKHWYCRDLDYAGPRKRRQRIETALATYYGIPELAWRRGVSERSTWEWAQKHPHLAITVQGRKYYRDEEYGRPKKAAPVIERDGHTYYSTAELARRRGICRQSAREWATRHPALTRRQGRFLYTRDEQYTPRKESVELPIHLKTFAARRPRR